MRAAKSRKDGFGDAGIDTAKTSARLFIQMGEKTGLRSGGYDIDEEWCQQYQHPVGWTQDLRVAFPLRNGRRIEKVESEAKYVSCFDS